MPGFFFFTDPSLLSAQAEADAFGPVAGMAATRFRVTSAHKATSDAGAHAVCDGHVLVQEQAGNATLVNLLLLPAEVVPFNSQRVRCFVYRGLRKDSLFTGTGTSLALKAKPADAKALLSLYYGEHAKARASNASLPANPPVEVTGIRLATEEDFRKATFTSGAMGTVQAPLVSAGTLLGTFPSAGFGFEVVVEQPGSELSLAEARAAETVLAADDFTDTMTALAWLGSLLKREALLRYMDPCAFFGGFYQLEKAAQQLKNPKDGTALGWDALVTGPLSKYFNKNTTWLDLRGEGGLSLDYFRSYGSYTPATPAKDYKVELQLGLKPANDKEFTARQYQGRANPWPLVALKATELIGPLSSASWAIPVRLKLPLGDNPKPVSVLAMGVVGASYAKGARYPKNPPPKTQLTSHTFDTGAAHTKEALTLMLPNATKSTTLAPISTWIRIDCYVGALDTAATRGLRPRAGTPLELLFAPSALLAHLPAGTDTRYKALANPALLRGQDEFGFSFLATVGVASDASNHTFFAFGTQPVSDPAVVLKPPSRLTGGRDSRTSFHALIESLYSAKKLRRSELLISGTKVPYLEFSDKPDAPGLTPGSEHDHLLLVTLSRDELKRLETLAQQKLVPGSQWFLTFADEARALDGKGYPYRAYKVGIRGIASTAAGLATQEHFPETAQTIKVHSYGHPQ